jgi:hypothetical protein
MEQNQNNATAATAQESTLTLRFDGGYVNHVVAMAQREQCDVAQLVARA